MSIFAYNKYLNLGHINVYLLYYCCVNLMFYCNRVKVSWEVISFDTMLLNLQQVFGFISPTVGEMFAELTIALDNGGVVYVCGNV